MTPGCWSGLRTLGGSHPRAHPWLTIPGHAQRQAFLQAAMLASVTAGSVDGAILLASAGVGHVAVLASAEEALWGAVDTSLHGASTEARLPVPHSFTVI